MLRRHGTALRMTLMAVDGVTAAIIFLAVSAFRFGPSWRASWGTTGIDPFPLLIAWAVTWTLTLWMLGLYRMRARWSWKREWVDILRAILLIAVATLAFLYLAKLPDVSRVFLGELFVAQAVVAVLSRALVRSVYRSVRTRGQNGSFVLVVGDGAAARTFARQLAAHASLGMRVAGFVASPPPGTPEPGTARGPGGSGTPAATGPGATAPVAGGRVASTVPVVGPGVLGEIADLPDILHRLVIDEVAVCLPVEALAFLEPVVRLCEDEGKIVRIPLESAGLTLPGGTLDMFDEIPVLSFVHGPDRALALIAKRLLDMAGATAALVLLSPVLALVALLIRLKDGSPVLFSQERIGLQGRPFRVLKFRTMARDAEARLEELVEQNEIRGQAFKVTDDPRVTPLGRILRRTSIDELPQLLNVLRGQMSLVGPRPPLSDEVAAYDVWHRRRLAMKPGITGLWQVSARRDADFDRWVRLDLDYIDRWSLLLDLRIILRTIPAMLQGR